MQVNYKNTIIDIKKGPTVVDLLKNEILKYNSIACRFNNEIKSLNYEIEENGKLELIDISDKDGMRIYMRGLLFIVSKAVEELYLRS